MLTYICTYIHTYIYIYIYIHIYGDAHGVMVILIGNGHNKLSSNPSQGSLHFTQL